MMKVTELLLRGYFLVGQAVAQVFDGPGLYGGVGAAAQIEGPAKATLRQIILSFLYKALFFLALLAVVMIVVAGFILVLSQGKEELKEKAKKIIIYVIVGLIVILLARAVVGVMLYGLFP